MGEKGKGIRFMWDGRDWVAEHTFEKKRNELL